ncbi:MAG: hypothetical protein MUF54_15650, partial [Polyangiaceae bacterium]|nr:hypothetical protein [Polyangiaceae bacterium]
MSFDTEWLHRITNEVAKAPAPEPDWDRIEHKLFMRITRHPLPRPVAHVCPPWCALLGIAAVAATLTLAVATVLNSSPVARPPPLGACAARTVVPSDLGALAPLRTGDTLDASSRQMTVHHGGWVTFTLDPGSHACIDALDDGMDLQL